MIKALTELGREGGACLAGLRRMSEWGVWELWSLWKPKGSCQKGRKSSLLLFFLSLSPFFFFFFFFGFLGPHPQYMEVPRLGVESELQRPAYTTATAMQDPSCICDLHHSPRQRWILNALSRARDGTRNLMFLVGLLTTVPRRERLTLL